ncbi:MAG: ATP-dependent RecD-like DNA helicase [Acidobacteriota bacterium]
MFSGKIINQKLKIRRKIFISEENGFAVFKAAFSGRKESRIIVGNLFDVREGDILEIEGEEVFHPRFGDQIKVTRYKTLLPEDTDGIIKYLSSGRVKGVGKKSAGKIVEKFGKDTFEIIENTPDRLKEVTGLRKKTINSLINSLKENKTLRELIVKLSPFGIGSETVFKIYREFEDSTYEILEQNPYAMIERIKGVGFKRADMIAKGFGIKKNDPNRIRAGINFILTQNEERNGDLYMEEGNLVNSSASVLSVSHKEISEEISSLLDRNELISEEKPEKIILSYKNFLLEKAISRYIYNLSQKTLTEKKIKIDLDTFFGERKIELTDEQKEAVKYAVNKKISIITGGPGTGKTTIIKAIIEIFEKEGQLVKIAAPTGRAAKRIEESSYYQTSTIHRLLKISPETKKFIHDESNPLKADAIIIDEFSMVDTNIFYSLLKAISINARLIIIGDKDQLPSVGPGNILRDLIESKYFKTIYLNRNFRQKEESLIIENAYRINKGEKLEIKPYSDELDFVFIRGGDTDFTLGKVKRIIEYLKNDFTFNSLDYQVLSPVYRGDLGINNLNRMIQENFNPNDFILKSEKLTLKKFDKVMQLKNNYDKEIFNGEHGTLKEYDKQNNRIYIDFEGNIIEYTKDEFEEITLSYAISIHKSQGSEYDYLILVLSPAHSVMLNRELLYTAVTRAKKKIFLISDEDTLKKAITTSTPNLRKTLLPVRLKEQFET